jgi:ribosomal protein S18 acetylase RimI-like enzyme
MAIRAFEPSDYEALIALWERAGLEHKPTGRDAREALCASVSQACVALFVAEREGQLVGSVLATHDTRRGWINRLAIDPSHQRRGLARQLVRRAEELLFTQEGLEIVSCVVYQHNQPSLSLFQGLDYVLVEDVRYLSKRLRPDA